MQDNDIEHFLATFERIVRQQGWPDDVWATQLAGILMGKALAAYAGLSVASYEEVKQAILYHYDAPSAVPDQPEVPRGIFPELGRSP